MSDDPKSTLDKFLKVAKGVIRSTAIILLAVIIYVVVIAQSIVGVYGYTQYISRPQVHLGSKDEVLTATLNNEGGQLIVDNPESAINGFAIDVPEATFDKDLKFEITTKAIEEFGLKEGFEIITPLISIDNKEVVGSEPMVISLPIDIDEDEFAMFFYYRKDGTFEALPYIYQDQNTVVAQTVHFSDIVVLKTEKANLDQVDINTNFKPGVDDWAFSNNGSQIAPRGHCSGQTATMMYYFIYKKKALGISIRDKYDNNNYDVKTPRLGWDDSLGYRLASVTQSNAKFQSAYYRAVKNLIHYRKSFSGQEIYYSFAMPMLLTDEPQMISIRVRKVVNGEPDLQYGHAILVYRITGDALYVADPNFPGEVRTISYDGENLGTYVSTTRSGNKTYNYNSFANISISGIYDMNEIGRNFREIEKSVNASTIGYGMFTDTGIEVLTDIKFKRSVYTSNTKDIELSPEAMTRIKERYKDSEYVPDDWMDKNYIIVRAISEASDAKVRVYRGTEKLVDVTPSVKKGKKSYFIIDIGEGKKDLGFLFYQGVQRDTDTGTKTVNKFIHFHRLYISNDDFDFEGEWEGIAQITDASRSRIFLEMIFTAVVRLVEAIGNMFVSIFAEPDPPMTDTEVKAEVDRIIDEIDWSKLLIPVEMDIEKIDDKSYNITYRLIQEDEEPVELQTIGKVRNNQLQFKIIIEKVTFKVILKPIESKRLAGKFRLSLFGYGKLIDGKFDVAKE